MSNLCGAVVAVAVGGGGEGQGAGGGHTTVGGRRRVQDARQRRHLKEEGGHGFSDFRNRTGHEYVYPSSPLPPLLCLTCPLYFHVAFSCHLSWLTCASFLCPFHLIEWAPPPPPHDDAAGCLVFPLGLLLVLLFVVFVVVAVEEEVVMLTLPPPISRELRRIWQERIGEGRGGEGAKLCNRVWR